MGGIVKGGVPLVFMFIPPFDTNFIFPVSKDTGTMFVIDGKIK